ncbi:MAG: hypothetical protein P3B98_01630 [Gemmatimonadota bacterium]|nr:hypothetical protein [Gemmatimonadota bacterium]
MEIHALLDAGVARGVISDDQRAALLALVGTMPAESAQAVAGDRSMAAAREAPRAFNGITIAYGIGALVVLFAFAWFMIDRWRVLGDGGVLLLSLGYAAVFLLVAHVLQREGFGTARGVAMLLAVAMAPLAMRAFLRWSGMWTPDLDRICRMPEHPFAACQGDPLAIELATVAAAMLAMRAMSFSPFMIPIAVVCVTFPERLLREWSGGPHIDGAVMGWRWAIIASCLAAAAYTMDRRRREEDYAFWMWIAVAATTWFAGILLFQTDRSLRPWLAPVALLVITASVVLRRRALLVVGLMGVMGFLAWLATDVFKVTTTFPLVLALLGVSIIIVTVWVQKRFPDVIQRLGGDPSAPPQLPGGFAMLLAPALLGVLLLNDARSIDRERAADRRIRSQAGVSRMRAQRDSVALRRAAGQESPAKRPE